MKKKMLIICVLFLLLSGCGKKWPGYSGTQKKYEYYHDEERDRNWEEDVISVMTNFAGHSYLKNEEMSVHDQHSGSIWKENHYNKDLHEKFLHAVNELIPKISEMNDIEILYEMQRIIALLQDEHSMIFLPKGDAFPIAYEIFYQEEKANFYVVDAIDGYENLIYSKLISINGIAIEEILERVLPYISASSNWGAYGSLCDLGYQGTLQHKNLLCVTDVMDFEDESADFVFELNGDMIEITLSTMKNSEYKAASKIVNNSKVKYSIAYENYGKDYSWFRMLDENDAAYLRIVQFAEGKGQNLYSAVDEMKRAIDNLGHVDKVIIDVRNNVGGNGSTSVQHLIDVLNTRNIDQVYVLIDDSSYSMSVAAAIRIRNEVDNSLLAGIPAGTGSSTFSVSGNSKQFLHSDNYYQVGGIFSYLDESQEYDALMPDLKVYPTVEDYKQGKDTVLDFILSLENKK